MRVVDLRCERLVEPEGLDRPHPRLTWRIDCDERDVVQTAYELETDRWSTGRVESWRQQVTYDGPPSSVVRWRVRVWTNVGESAWSEWATFKRAPTEWVARMITAPKDVVRFAKVFEAPDDVVTARLRLTAHGIVYASINGVDVGDEVLAPGWTSYDNRLAVPRTT